MVYIPLLSVEDVFPLFLLLLVATNLCSKAADDHWTKIRLLFEFGELLMCEVQYKETR